MTTPAGRESGFLEQVNENTASQFFLQISPAMCLASSGRATHLLR